LADLPKKFSIKYVLDNLRRFKIGPNQHIQVQGWL